MLTDASLAAAESLDGLAVRFGTDKRSHGYLPHYEHLLGPRRAESLDLLEIGVGSGYSVRTWLAWLPAAQVHGLDLEVAAYEAGGITEAVPGGHGRLTLWRGDQADHCKLVRLFPPSSLDVVIDDGSHRVADQLVSCLALWPALRSGGLYFIEDVQDPVARRMLRLLPGWLATYDTGPHHDDVLVVLRKQ